MLVLVAVLLTLIPLVAITYPFVRRLAQNEVLEDESSPHAELERRWESALAGLRTTEVEYGIGTLSEEDYRWLREQQMVEAAQVMKAMELEEEQEQDMLSRLLSSSDDDASSSNTQQPSSDKDAPESLPDSDCTGAGK